MRTANIKSYRTILCLLLFSLFLSAAGCSKKAYEDEDILTQKLVSSDKIPITILVKYAFTINTFETEAEKKFPNLDIIQVGNYTRDMGIAEYSARLEHDDLTDIVMTWPLAVGEEYWKDRLIDLSGMEFSSRYNTSMLSAISRDGALYYLPGPAQVRGIVYNKTLFKENGWEVPNNYEEFIALCQAIEKTGIKALQLPFGNSETLDTAFTGFGFGACYSTVEDRKWLQDYDLGIGSFGDHFQTAFDTFEQMRDAGIWQSEDLDVYYQDREKMLFTRQCAMAEDSVLMARMGYSQTGTTDEFALMPFFNPGEDNDWARLYMVCYIGMNKQLTNPENKEKYELALSLMDYISTPEGQDALSADTGAMYSNLKSVSPPNVPEIKDLLPALEHGRYAIFPTLKNAQSALREALTGILTGSLSREDAIKMIDNQNILPVTNAQQKEVLGTAAEDFTLIDTGSFVTDAMREYSGCDLALFLDNGKDGKYNGKGISARLYQGDITVLDLERVLPDLKHGETGTLWKIKMTGENLVNTLEYSIPVDNNVTGWFYYFSGLKIEYSPSAEPGSRIKSIYLADGSSLDLQKEYSIAVMDETVPEEYILSCEKEDITIISLLSDFIKGRNKIEPSHDGRFTLAVPSAE